MRRFEQRYSINFDETFTSVVKLISYKALFAIMAAFNLELK